MKQAKFKETPVMTPQLPTVVKNAKEFRLRCRELAFRQLRRCERIMGEDETIPSKDLEALTTLADRGGLLRGQDLATVEALRGRLLLEALSLPNMTEEMKLKIISSWRKHEDEVLGAVEEPAQLAASTEDPKP